MADQKTELGLMAKEIRDIIDKKQKELELTFVEDDHIYYIKDKSGKIRTDFPSVSTVYKQFYSEFPALDKSLEMSGGDILQQDRLLKEWRATADYANSKGSRVHYLLEKDLLKQYGSYKEVRKPYFECDEQQTKDGNAMVDAGHNFIRLMHRRGAILLDTEMVLGSSELEYTGQPDKVWLIFDKDGILGFIVTDWKTNKIKNFEVHSYTVPMLEPFEEYMDTALAHYKIQLPLYARLILDMLKGSKYEDIKFLGAIIVHLTAEGRFSEIRVPKEFTDVVMTMEPLTKIDEVLEYKNNEIRKEEIRVAAVAEAKFIMSENS
tara:strand:+ start:81847 stop:82806 length:960 start_codon:yes stop_codon:yes gene_type:complete